MTEFLGGNGNHKFGGFVIKVIIVIALILAAFFIGVTRDWISVTKEGAVSAQRIEQVEKNFSAHVVWAESEKGHFVRKDVIDAKLADVTRRLDRIEQLLLEDRRKK